MSAVFWAHTQVCPYQGLGYFFERKMRMKWQDRRMIRVVGVCWPNAYHMSIDGSHPLLGVLAGLRVRRAEVRELLENVGVRLEAGGGNIAFGEEGEAMINDVVSKNAPIWILGRPRRIEAQHVRQNAVSIDRRDRFFAGVIARMSHQVDKLIRPTLAIVDRLAGVVFQFGVVGIEEAADAWVARAIDMNQLAVLAHTAPTPDPDLRFAPSSLVGSSITVENTLASVFESTPVHGTCRPHGAR